MRRFLVLPALALLVAASGCDSAEPDVPSIAGTWAGSVTLPNGFTTRMELQQTGVFINGTARISGQFIDAPISGEIDGAGRFVWTILRGCETWTGSLAITPGEMNGSVNLNGGSCSRPSSATGSMRLTRN